MEDASKSFKDLMFGMILIGLVMLFWNNFRADTERRYGIRSTNSNRVYNTQPGQVVRQQLYPAGYNNGGPATVYYTR